MLRVDTSEAESFLDGLWKDQIPFAASLALNTTAKDAQRAIQTHVAGAFILRRADFILRETAKIPRFSNKNDPELSVTIQATQSVDFMHKFEGGITKESITGRQLAIPVAARPSKGELVPQHLRPRELRLRAHRTATGKVQLKGKFGTFVIKGVGIFQRDPGEASFASEIRLLYLFRRRARTPASLRFREIGERVVRETWPGHWAAAFARAIRTAR